MSPHQQHIADMNKVILQHKQPPADAHPTEAEAGEIQKYVTLPLKNNKGITMRYDKDSCWGYHQLELNNTRHPRRKICNYTSTLALVFDIVKGLQEDEIIHKDNNPTGLRHITDDYNSK